MVKLLDTWDYELRNYMIQRRIQLGVSQQWLADELRCSQARISCIERGLYATQRLDFYAAWAAVLDVRLEFSIIQGNIRVRAYDLS